MKTTLLLLLFPLLLVLVAHAADPGETDQGFKLKCPEETIKAQIGQNVTLNCTSEPQRDLREKPIRWEFNEKFVLNFKDRKISRHQDKQFTGRVHTVNGWDVSKGKLSVEISSVDETDAGVYTCSVVYGPNCTVTLTVDIKPPHGNSTEKPGAQGGNTTTCDGSNNCTGIGIGAGFGGLVLGAIIVALVGWLIYKKCRNRRKKRNERGSSQDDQEDVALQEVETEPSRNAGE